MKQLDILTPIGVALGCTLIFLSISMGSNVSIFFSISSFLIVMGGSFSALLVNYRWKEIVVVFKTLKKLMNKDAVNNEEIVEMLTDLARKSRKEGLLGLEDDVHRMDDRFYQKGLRLAIDALDPDFIKDIMETDIEATMLRHQAGQGVFRTWGALTPSFGMIGTLIGLIQMLSKLDDPSTLGPSMALALITTFYGALMANLVLLPIAGKLEVLSNEEILTKRIILDGILAIQSGINPRVLEEKLRSYIEPKADNWGEEAEYEAPI